MNDRESMQWQEGENSPGGAPRKRNRKAWEPDGDDHLVYRWVKFEGKKQGWVASQLGIHQATVSRIVERYERWQAHAQERDGGRLDLAEQRRAQWWLTFERNELMLASALRIADEMEGFKDVSKSVIARPMSHPSEEREVRTEHAVMDRTGAVSRFLRLAFRINMEQFKLIQSEPPPAPAPLTAEQLAAEQEAAQQAHAEFAAKRAGWEEEYARRAAEQAEQEAHARQQQQLMAEALERVSELEAEAREGAESGDSDTTESRMGCAHHPENAAAEDAGQNPPQAEVEVGGHIPPSEANLHNLHTENEAEIDASIEPVGSCAAEGRKEKIVGDACMDESPARRREWERPRNGHPAPAKLAARERAVPRPVPT